MLVSTNRTVVRLVAAQPVGGAELVDAGLDLALQCLQPGELIHPARQLLKVGHDQRAHRGVTLCGGDPGIAVDVIRDGYRNILHSFTVTLFLCELASGPAQLAARCSSTGAARLPERSRSRDSTAPAPAVPPTTAVTAKIR